MSETNGTQEVIADHTATQEAAKDLTASWLSSKIEALSKNKKGERQELKTPADRFLGNIDALEKGKEVVFSEEDGVKCELSKNSNYKTYEYSPSGSMLISAKKNREGKYECSVKINDKIETRVMSAGDLKRIYFSASRETVLEMAEKDGLRDVVALGLNAEENTELTTKKIEDIALERKFTPNKIISEMIENLTLNDQVKTPIEALIANPYLKPEEVAQVLTQSGFFDTAISSIDDKIKILSNNTSLSDEQKAELDMLRVQKNLLKPFFEQFKDTKGQELLTNTFNNMKDKEFAGFIKVARDKDPQEIAKYIQNFKTNLSEEDLGKFKHILNGLAGGGILSAFILLYIYSQQGK